MCSGRSSRLLRISQAEPSPEHPVHGCHVQVLVGAPLEPSPQYTVPALPDSVLSPLLAARGWWNSCFDLQNADCQNISHSRRLGVTIRDAELLRVEIPTP